MAFPYSAFFECENQTKTLLGQSDKLRGPENSRKCGAQKWIRLTRKTSSEFGNTINLTGWPNKSLTR
jgi:hypothetical protein